ncbi:hypothetical protein Tdes44962_MAKER06913 [Teratosphaeria destructans]|uniref:Uncharacterized protein n=1 Tax=Teratosphaeria destructans TaxID=418781 RepID=A0A9W7T0J6_9PEZI|nr:hypothetical protein Tdes44962_MAKER06913 [Teratosphaeria destructans]
MSGTWAKAIKNYRSRAHKRTVNAPVEEYDEAGSHAAGVRGTDEGGRRHRRTMSFGRGRMDGTRAGRGERNRWFSMVRR